MMSTPSAIPLLETQPGVASAEDGMVILDGPDGVAVTMTADAAHRTGESLLSAARIAQQQAMEQEHRGDV